jgi:hypothetical protein
LLVAGRATGLDDTMVGALSDGTAVPQLEQNRIVSFRSAPHETHFIIAHASKE